MNNRLLSLDLLRGIAVLLVIFRHSDGVATTFLEPLRRGGWVAVDLFFVLSGYLVSGLLFKEFQKTGSIQPIRFLIRRGWKIYPAFWALLAVTGVMFMVLGGPNLAQRMLTEMTFMQSYCETRLWAHTWSLAVEEHFYLILPFVLLGLSANNFKALPRVVAAIMVALFAAKCINSVRPFTEQTHLFATHLRLDAMFFGVLLCYWHQQWPAFGEFCKCHSRVLIVAGVLLLAPAFIFKVEEVKLLHTIGLTTNILASGAILMGMVCGGVADTALNRTLGWIGTYSYSIYLWHNLVIFIIAPMLGIHNPIIFSVVGSVIFGIVASRIIEMPALKLRDTLAAAPVPA
jgi:peptidoglycan/LPS O-acetylase OafA/YrhL